VADGRGRIFVNLESKSAIMSFDAHSLKQGPLWSLAPGEEPTGLAYDADHHRLFAGCSNKLMMIIDSESGRVVGGIPVGDGVDGAAFDPGLRLAFTPNGEGTLTVVREETPDKFTVVETVPTQKGGRTLALDASTHRIYIPTAEFGPPPAPTPERPRPRPSIVPGTFTVLVLEPKSGTH
jgi:DNA-binding beta-propeller fold protein YncE